MTYINYKTIMVIWLQFIDDRSDLGSYRYYVKKNNRYSSQVVDPVDVMLVNCCHIKIDNGYNY